MWVWVILGKDEIFPAKDGTFLFFFLVEKDGTFRGCPNDPFHVRSEMGLLGSQLAVYLRFLFLFFKWTGLVFLSWLKLAVCMRMPNDQFYALFPTRLVVAIRCDG